MEKLKRYLQSISELPESDWDIFSAKLQRRQLTKKHQLLKAGEVENYLSFLEKGIVRYWIPGKDREITFEIAFENSFATAYDSFLTRLPSNYFAETIADSVLWSVTYNDLQDIFVNSQSGNKIGRLASEDLYIKKTRRQISFLKDTAEQRYLNLLNDQPHLIQHVPLQYLASFIGITPQALSRIRRRIS